MKRFLVVVLACLAVQSCGQDETGQRPDPIVVYAPGDAGSAFADLFAEFTEESGILVSAKWGDSSELSNAVIGKTGVPADVLLTDNLADIWRAAEEGALRPITADSLSKNAKQLRDVDGYWGALHVRAHSVVSLPATRPIIASLDTLADPQLVGRLCLSSSSLADNRALLAMVIEQRGVRETERLMRRIMANINLGPFDSGDKLIAAIRDGSCDYGIVAADDTLDALASRIVPPFTYTANAVGVGRHAKNPESAQRFVGWLLDRIPQVPGGEATWPHAYIAGYRDEEARLLAERVGYR